MKFKEFQEVAERVSRERHIPIADVEFEVSLWPMETPAEDGVRYFGDIHELMMNQGGVMILSDGERNIKQGTCDPLAGYAEAEDDDL